MNRMRTHTEIHTYTNAVSIVQTAIVSKNRVRAVCASFFRLDFSRSTDVVPPPKRIYCKQNVEIRSNFVCLVEIEFCFPSLQLRIIIFICFILRSTIPMVSTNWVIHYRSLFSLSLPGLNSITVKFKHSNLDEITKAMWIYKHSSLVSAVAQTTKNKKNTWKYTVNIVATFGLQARLSKANQTHMKIFGVYSFSPRVARVYELSQRDVSHQWVDCSSKSPYFFCLYLVLYYSSTLFVNVNIFAKINNEDKKKTA